MINDYYQKVEKLKVGQILEFNVYFGTNLIYKNAKSLCLSEGFRDEGKILITQYQNSSVIIFRVNMFYAPYNIQVLFKVG